MEKIGKTCEVHAKYSNEVKGCGTHYTDVADNFYASGYEGGFKRHCKECDNARRQKHQATRKESFKYKFSLYRRAVNAKLIKQKALSKNEREHILKLSENKCCNCGTSKNLEIDHFFPYSAGYKIRVGNACVLCGKCNRQKGKYLPEEFFGADMARVVNQFGIVFQRPTKLPSTAQHLKKFKLFESGI